MLTEALQRLSVFGKLSSYRYVGFGSIYFSDFKLFHRLLGISRMTSIEKDSFNKERFEFNKPFRCIDLKFGLSNDILPTLSWKDKTILWLDYDGALNKDCLSDIAEFCTKAPSGSALIVTVNAEFDKAELGAFQQFEEAVGKENVPIGITIKDMKGAGAAKVLREIIVNKIAETLSARNGVRQKQQRLNYLQFVNFHYADNARMLTIGGVIWKNSQAETIKSGPWNDLPYIKHDADPYVIDAPCLTTREIRYMDSHLPIGPEKAMKFPVPKEQREKYAKIYRYYPAFTEAEL
ncbi:MAG: hypothetical protein B7Y27_08875 [Hydrogenophilales bacterium 16-64-40]|nr:MAG: hypothetical protein B7Y27_08875 [Hydrogenophilales bacterium 16-64-40]